MSFKEAPSPNQRFDYFPFRYPGQGILAAIAQNKNTLCSKTCGGKKMIGNKKEKNKDMKQNKISILKLISFRAMYPEEKYEWE